MSDEEKKIITYKGFDADLKCRGFQYELGASFTHEGEVETCSSGFHACEYPLEVFCYYLPGSSRFAVVEQSGKIARQDSSTKVASSKIKICAELSISGLIKAAIEYTTSRCTEIDTESPTSATGYRGAASATGDQGAASATGYQGAASATGYQGAASATGYHAVSMASGYQGKAKACAGSAIVVCYRNDYGDLMHIKAAIAGCDGIKPDTWYILDSDGEFQEAE